MILVGVVECTDDNIIVDMIRRIITNSGLKFSVVSSEEFQSSTNPRKLVKSYLDELEKNKHEVAIIKVRIDMIIKEVYKDIKFNIVVYDTISQNAHNSFKQDFISHGKKLLNEMTENDIAITNIDDMIVFELLKGSKMRVVTYGLCSKASVTASSIEDDGDIINFTCCLQRTVCALDKSEMVLQEFPVKVKSTYDNADYSALAAVSTALVIDIPVRTISSTLL